MKASCQCGALSATIAPDAEPYVVACHCIDCQKRTGSPFGAMAYFPCEAVTISGEKREFARIADSGFAYTTSFCPECGTTISGQPARMPEITGITVGCFDDGAIPAPTRSVYEKDKCDWVDLVGEISCHPLGRDS